MTNSLRFVTSLLALLLSANGLSAAQTTSAKPSDGAPSKDVAAVRTQRDAYWDKVNEGFPPGMIPTTCGGQDVTGDEADFTIYSKHRVILTGVVTGQHVVLTGSGHSFYGEQLLEVDHVFQDLANDGHLATHQILSLLSFIGPNEIANGLDLSFPTNPCRGVLEVGHKYLLGVDYTAQGDFYVVDDAWDITDGVVRAYGSRNLFLVQSGHSKLEGIPAQQLGPALDKLLNSACMRSNAALLCR